MRSVVLTVTLVAVADWSWAASPALPKLEVFGVPTMQKITPTEGPGPDWLAGQSSVECARNEWEAIQIVVRSPKSVSDLMLRVSDLRHRGGGVLQSRDFRLRRVVWVDINAPVDLDEPSETPDFRPDPLVSFDPAIERFSLEPGRNFVLWLMVGVPETAAAGLYEGDVTISTGTAHVITQRLALRVRDFTLPRRPLLQSMVGIAMDNLYFAHGCRNEAEREAIARLYLEEYIRARLSPFLYAPSTIAFNPLPGGRISWTFEKGPDGLLTGAARMDFTGFDREAVLYLDKRQAFSAFNIAPYLWTRRERNGRREVVLQIRDSTNTAVDRLGENGLVNPLFDTLVTSVFRQLADHLDKRGWLDLAVYYVADEPREDDVPALKLICTLVRRAAPRLRTALTYDPAYHPRLAELMDGNGRSLISIWIPYNIMYRKAVAAVERAKGADYWLYDVRETSLIDQSALATRAMLWTVWQHDAKGYLYYLSTHWGKDTTPWDRPNFLVSGIPYRRGSGYFFYPPQRRSSPAKPDLATIVTTIRWEMLREGAEDYDTLRLLQELTEHAERLGLPTAAVGRETLVLAREQAKGMTSTFIGVWIANMDFGNRTAPFGAVARTGWTYNDQDGWLRHVGGQRSDLAISFAADVPDGCYELVVRVYATGKRTLGRPFSRFMVDGQKIATPPTTVDGPVDVSAGKVIVSNGMCRFTLSSVEEDAGVVLYKVTLHRQGSQYAAGFPVVRARIADAIEHLQADIHTQR